MDRGAFFHALPFLTPSTAKWPCGKVVLKDNWVSVEPTSGAPACFAAHGVDPGIFRLDVAISTDTVKITSPAASSVSTSLSVSTSQQSPALAAASTSSGSQEAEYQQEFVYLQIDQRFVFQVHLDDFRGVQVQLPDEGDKSGDNKKSIANIVLCFDACSFRIFSDQSNDSTLEALKAFAARIKEAANTHQRLSIFRNVATEKTPSSGHKHKDDGAIMRRIKRRRQSLHKSWNGLQSLQATLKMPGDANAVHTLLTETAEDLSSSYCRGIDVQCAMQASNEALQECDKELDQVLGKAFPGRRNSNGSSPTDMESVMETTQQLLDKREEAFKERLRLALLPTRG